MTNKEVFIKESKDVLNVFYMYALLPFRFLRFISKVAFMTLLINVIVAVVLGAIVLAIFGLAASSSYLHNLLLS